MSDQTRQQLQQAYELIRAGQREQAGTILVAILRQDRNNADAWWLLANASSDAEKTRQALENVLRIRPDDARARQKLDSLNPPPSAHFGMPISPSSSPSTPADDPFGSFPTPSWEVKPADDLPMVPAFGDFDMDTLDVTADDPFPEEPTGKPKKGSDSVISRPGARTVDTSGSDPFGEVNYGGDPFADVGALRPQKNPPRDPLAPQPKRSGANPVVVVLIIAVVACLACTAVGVIGALNGGSALFSQVQQVLLTVTSNPDFATVIASSGTLAAMSSNAGNGQDLPGGLNNRGSLSYGQSLTNTVSSTKDDSWTFTGAAGDSVTIEVDAKSDDLDPQLELYGTTDKQIAQNDDIDFGENKNSRITITLPASGTYTIVISAFGSGGDYTLRLTRG